MFTDELVLEALSYSGSQFLTRGRGMNYRGIHVLFLDELVLGSLLSSTFLGVNPRLDVDAWTNVVLMSSKSSDRGFAKNLQEYCLV